LDDGRTALVAVLGTALALACGCGHKNEYEMRREAQQAQAKTYVPASLEREDRSWRAFRRARVRLYVDPAYTRRDANVRGHFAERLERANEVLEPALRLRLSLDELRELPKDAAAGDLDAALAAIARLDPGEDVDFVVVLIGAAPLATLSFHDLGRAHVLGRHIAMRSMDDADELRALATYDALDAEERSRLYQQRKRHKEAAVLLHEIGHTLGGLHVRDRADLMNAEYDQAMQRFAEANVDLMQRVLSWRAQPAGERDARALVTEIKERLEQSKWDGFVEEERAEYLANLDRALAGGATQTVATQTAAAQAAPQAPKDAPDLGALPEADRKLFADLDALAAARKYDELRASMRDLAGRYPDCYAVQHKACELAMRFGASRRELSGYCDRMTTLAAQPTCR
jgi:hypothetical protein